MQVSLSRAWLVRFRVYPWRTIIGYVTIYWSTRELMHIGAVRFLLDIVRPRGTLTIVRFQSTREIGFTSKRFCPLGFFSGLLADLPGLLEWTGEVRNDHQNGLKQLRSFFRRGGLRVLGTFRVIVLKVGRFQVLSCSHEIPPFPRFVKGTLKCLI